MKKHKFTGKKGLTLVKLWKFGEEAGMDERGIARIFSNLLSQGSGDCDSSQEIEGRSRNRPIKSKIIFLSLCSDQNIDFLLN
jgi:hypothetical protein